MCAINFANKARSLSTSDLAQLGAGEEWAGLGRRRGRAGPRGPSCPPRRPLAREALPRPPAEPGPWLPPSQRPLRTAPPPSGPPGRTPPPAPPKRAGTCSAPFQRLPCSASAALCACGPAGARRSAGVARQAAAAREHEARRLTLPAGRGCKAASGLGPLVGPQRGHTGHVRGQRHRHGRAWAGRRSFQPGWRPPGRTRPPAPPPAPMWPPARGGRWRAGSAPLPLANGRPRARGAGVTPSLVSEGSRCVCGPRACPRRARRRGAWRPPARSTATPVSIERACTGPRRRPPRTHTLFACLQPRAPHP
jgi:hypothetical protein